MIRSFYPLGNHASKNENNFVHLHVKFCSKTLTMKGFISKLQIIYLSNCCVNLLDTKENYTHTYSPFIVAKPKWTENGLLEYQEQAVKMMKDSVKTFNDADDIPILSELFSKA